MGLSNSEENDNCNRDKKLNLNNVCMPPEALRESEDPGFQEQMNRSEIRALHICGKGHRLCFVSRTQG